MDLILGFRVFHERGSDLEEADWGFRDVNTVVGSLLRVMCSL